MRDAEADDIPRQVLAARRPIDDVMVMTHRPPAARKLTAPPVAQIDQGGTRPFLSRRVETLSALLGRDRHLRKQEAGVINHAGRSTGGTTSGSPSAFRRRIVTVCAFSSRTMAPPLIT